MGKRVRLSECQQYTTILRFSICSNLPVAKGHFSLITQACETLQLSAAFTSLAICKIGLCEMSQVDVKAEGDVLVVDHVQVGSFNIYDFVIKHLILLMFTTTSRVSHHLNDKF